MRRTWAMAIVGASVCGAFVACGGTSGSDVVGGSDDAGGGTVDSGGASTDGSSATDSGTGTTDSGGSSDSGGGDAGKDVNVPPLPDGGVTGVPGVVLWLDAAKGITPDMTTASKVAKWADQSGNGNDAAQANTNYRPQLVATGINGLPVIRFTATVSGQQYGNMFNVPDSATLQWGTGDYLVEIVTKYDNAVSAVPATEAATGYGALFLKQTFGGATNTGVAFFANTPAGIAAGTTAPSSYVDTGQGLSGPTGFNDGTARLLATQRTGATALAIRVNGHQVANATVASTNVDTVATGLRIGGNGDATLARLNGDIAEIIAVKGSISPADLAGIEGYLKNKYGL